MPRYLSIFTGFALCFSGCSPRVIHFVNSSANFESYNTFVVVNYKVNNAGLSPEGLEIISGIVEVINGEMIRRGYDISHQDPDLLVRYEIISNQRTEVNQNTSPFYPSLNWGSSFSTRTFLESALLIEIMDVETKKVIWQASVDLNKYRKNNKDEILQIAITRLFNTYLYRAGSERADESLKID